MKKETKLTVEIDTLLYQKMKMICLIENKTLKKLIHELCNQKITKSLKTENV